MVLTILVIPLIVYFQGRHLQSILQFLKQNMAQFSGMGLSVDSPGIDEALLLDDIDQPMETAPTNPRLADLMSQFGAAVQQGKQTNLTDPVWLERFTSVLALQQSGDGKLPPNTAQGPVNVGGWSSNARGHYKRAPNGNGGISKQYSLR